MSDPLSIPPSGGLGLTRHVGDAVRIGDAWVIVEGVSTGIVRLRIVAPPELRISRVDGPPREDTAVLPVRRAAR